jgi:serine/threonine protein kinase
VSRLQANKSSTLTEVSPEKKYSQIHVPRTLINSLEIVQEQMSEVNEVSSVSSSTLYDMLIDHYRLDSHYMQTAVSDLYKARDVNTKESLIVEVLLPSFNRQYGKQFVEKTQAVSQLHHPNIATIYNVGYVSPIRPYAAREFITGYPLRERLQQLAKQEMPVNSIYALKMVRELADALALAEAQQIYHHYLCPDRLILKNDGTLVLIDLGVPELPGGYKAYNPPLPPSYNNEYYLAPEQRNGKAVNGRSHVYTLGIILQQLLTGIPPAPPPTVWQRMRRLGQPVNLRHERPDLSSHLYELVEKCIHQEPWRRYSSLAELTAVIDATLEAETLYIQTGTVLPILPTAKERLPLVYFLIPITLMFVCIIGALAFIPSNLDNTIAYMQQLPASKANLVALQPPNPTQTIQSEVAGAGADGQTPFSLPSEQSDFRIEVAEPLQDQQYEIGATIVFTWTWPTQISPGQSFTVYVTDETGDQEVGQVITANEEGVYELSVNSASFAQDRGLYLWRVALKEGEKQVSVSETNMLRIVATPLPPTATATRWLIPTSEPVQPTDTATEQATAVPQKPIQLHQLSSLQTRLQTRHCLP